VRVVMDSKLTLPETLRVFGSEARTIVGTLAPVDSPRAKALTSHGVEVWALPEKEGKVALRPLLEKLGRSGVLHVMVEGGSEVFARFLTEGLFDAVKVFVAPKLVGASGISWVGPLHISQMSSALPLQLIEAAPIGEDVLLHLEKQKANDVTRLK
jgi:diaminohydroxyphosphoribosylaminopyrimidine deaminase/5-amino-6-(5-phosphoribosylamino)uracil reductase